jgi:CHAD domain-containing protein
MKAAEIAGLDCEASALEGAKVVLHARLEEMCALREKALDFSDIKGVHDMRVASRRLRSVVRDFLPLLPNRFPRKRLKAIADALGDVRDEDVAIKELDKLRAEAEGDVAAGIEHLTDEHRWRRERARAILEEKINEQTIGKLREKFDSALDGALKVEAEKSSRANQSKIRVVSFRHAGHKIILLRLTELQQLSDSLYQPFETKPLHRLRIAAKRLRYAMELFTPCGSNHLLGFAQEIAKLQKSLGDLHDCDVWIADLGARLSRWDENSVDNGSDADAQAPEHRADVWLLLHFVKERTRHFREALARWHEWETTSFFTHLSACLETAPGSLDSETSECAAPDAIASDQVAHEDSPTAAVE